jgi:septal ring factor EnvC (AmiA/AmiB activator)
VVPHGVAPRSVLDDLPQVLQVVLLRLDALPDETRVLLHSAGSTGISDPARSESIAYVTTALATDRAHFRLTVLEALRGRLDWPARGTVATRFGQVRDGGTRMRGMLIAAPAGAEVRAIAYGRVAWAGWMPHYGNLMVLEHGNEYYSLYGHNQALLREVGEWVGAGEVIAQVGDSGGQARSALYFELRRGRTPLNPQQWLVSR